MYVAIMRTTPEGRVAKYQPFADLQSAQAHVTRHAERYPDAFVATAPDAQLHDWKAIDGALVVDVDTAAAARREEAAARAELAAIAAEAVPLLLEAMQSADPALKALADRASAARAKLPGRR